MILRALEYRAHGWTLAAYLTVSLAVYAAVMGWAYWEVWRDRAGGRGSVTRESERKEL